MDKPIFVDYESKICSAFLNTVSNTVWDALGQAQTPVQARQFIGAVEEAPNDGGLYLRSNLAWVSASTSLQHNDLAGRSTADSHPISAITGLQSELDLLESANAAQDALIAGKASITYVDAENDAQDAAFAAADALNVKKTSNTGSALLPAGTDAQRDASPQVGAIRFSSTNTGWEGWNGTNWVSIGGGQMLGQALVKGIFYNSQNIAENLTVAAGQNGLSAGPITVDNGFEVTVANGSTWTVC